MAGDWIKMRSALLQSPKLISMARTLHDSAEFREWMTPGGDGDCNGQIVSDDALRCVTCALLLRVWSASREHGIFDGDDLVLPCIALSDLDVMAGVSGFGDAMYGVGWAEEVEDGVSLPNFREYNLPIEPRDKQKAYRERLKRKASQTVTKALRKPRNKKVTSLLSSSLVFSSLLSSGRIPEVLREESFGKSWDRWVQHRHEKKSDLHDTMADAQLKMLAAKGLEAAVTMIEHTITMGWQGLRDPEPKPSNGKPQPSNYKLPFDVDEPTT